MPPRKKPFSALQKKKQLQDKRERKRQQQETSDESSKRDPISILPTDSDDDHGPATSNMVTKLNEQPIDTIRKYDPNRYKLHFYQETKGEIELRKLKAMQPYTQKPEESTEVDIDDINSLKSLIDMPKRPFWNYKMTKQVLELREHKYFEEYIEGIFEKFGHNNLSFFEMNIETWRQLWRVIEMSDIILMIVDIRYPAMHFSPALYNHVVIELKKTLIIVLNKIDLVPPAVVISWKSYFESKFPQLKIVFFTSFPKDQNSISKEVKQSGIIGKKRPKKSFNPLGPKELLSVCEQIAKNHVDFTDWKEKLIFDATNVSKTDAPQIVSIETDNFASKVDHVPYKDGLLTIGCCGFPNVGKSSVINSLIGHKVVSVSRTPGHTKHFQTIFLTENVKLCDSPGLVFPSFVDRSLQILSGIFPIAQVRVPYSAVQYIAEHINLPRILGVETQLDALSSVKSTYDICDAWAMKKGYLTAKTGRPDTYRSANSLLRLNLEGRIVFWTCPPGFLSNKEKWINHPDTQGLIQTLSFGSCLSSEKLSSEEIISDSEISSESSDESGEEKYIKDKTESEIQFVARNPFDLLNDE